jgi:hypothetical protein
MTTVVHHTTPALVEDAPFSARAATPARAGKPRPKPEAQIVKDGEVYICSLPRAYAHKVHGGPYGNAGEPDLDACVDGRTVKLEAKQPGKKPTGAQLGRLRRWAGCGALVGWFTNNDHIRQLLDHLDDPVFVPDLAHPGCVCARHGGGR